MPLIYREYGKNIEITKFDHLPSQIRLPFAREKRLVYGERRYDSVKRTRQICVRRVSSALKEFGCPLFVSLTFRGDAGDAYRANKAIGSFQVRLRRTFAGCQSLFVPELSPHGRIHFHGLLFNVPLHFGDIKEGRRIVAYGSERTTRRLVALWGEGFVDCLQTDGSERLAHYIAKYITKAGSHTLFNAMHILRISQGFPKEYVSRDLVAEYDIYLMGEKYTKVHEFSVDNPFLGSVDKEWYK